MGGYILVPLRSLADVMHDAHQVAEVFPNGHFIYTSGKHGTGYVNYRPLGTEGHEALLREICVHLLRKALTGVDVAQYRNIVAVGPETMGAKMIKQIASMSEAEMPYIINTRTLLKDPANPGEFIWDADPKKVLDQHSLVIWLDDLLNLTSTFRKTAPMIYACGATIHSLATIGDRSSLNIRQEIAAKQVVSLERFSLEAQDEGDCHNCKQHVPVVNDLGHGKKWQALHPNYAGGFVSARSLH